MNSEVLIIGGGVIGLSIARSLFKRGFRRITILERGRIGAEASFAAAGMLAPNAETEKIDDFYHFCTASNNLYPQFAAELFDETRIDIELDTTGTFYLAFTETDSEEINHRFNLHKKFKLKTELLAAEDIRRAEPFISPDAREGLFFPDDRQVDNRKLIAALQRFGNLNKIEICENTEVKSLTIENGKATGAKTDKGIFSAGTVILAAGAWSSLIGIPELEIPKIKPIRGQMLSLKTLRRMFFHVIYTPRGYIVPRLDGKILAGATVEDVGFDKNLTASGIDFVWSNTVEIARSLEKIEIEEKWAGLRPASIDNLPLIGNFPPVENFFTATAHYRNGILLAPLTGEILAEKIAGNTASRYLEIFSPQRFLMAGGKR